VAAAAEDSTSAPAAAARRSAVWAACLVVNEEARDRLVASPSRRRKSAKSQILDRFVSILDVRRWFTLERASRMSLRIDGYVAFDGGSVR
jgi:hypothetical protein